MPPSGNNHRVSFPTLASQSSSHPHSNVEFDDRAESFAESDDQEKTSSFPMKQALIALFLVVLIAAVITVVVIFAKQGRDNVVQNQNQGQQGAGMGPVLPNSQSQQASSKTARSNNLSASPGTVRLDDLAKSLPGARPIATKQQAEAQSSSVHLNNPRAFAPVSISPSTPWQANNRQAARNSSDVCHGHYDKNGECLFKGFSSCGVNSRTVALTFDDGPSTDPAATRALLEELDSLGIPATFFSTPAQNGDSNEDLAPRCALVREIVSGRRVRHSVQSHSWDHRDFTSISPDELSQQMVLTEKFLETCGASPTQFRPPFGRLSPYQLRLMREKGNFVCMLSHSRLSELMLLCIYRNCYCHVEH